MLRKRKKTRRQPRRCKKNIVQLTPEAREQQAVQLLDAGQYKKAIAHCKELLKLERRPEWVDMLARAYLERASNLADKGMFKEAVAIWRNRADLCGVSLCDPLFFRLLAAAGQVDEALQLFADNQPELERQGTISTIRAQFAAVAVAGFDQVLNALPANDPVVKDYPAAMGALNAYCQGNDGQLREQLKGIPFRSPYRDLRQILKALLLSQDGSETASRLLAQITDNSPFLSLGHAVELTLQPDAVLFSLLPGEDRETRSFIATTKGWPKQQMRLINELIQLGQSPSPDALICLLIRNRELLGDEFAKQACMRLLIHSPKSSSKLKRAFGKLSPLEQATVKAQGLALKGAHPMEIIQTWSDGLEYLMEIDDGNDADIKLTMAMLLRHLLEMQKTLGAPDRVTLPLLLESLDYDPDDREGYLQLLPALRRENDLKAARLWVEQATKRFPEDIAILIEAVETALAGNAYKKAARLAAKILEKDPINQRVRSALINAHLFHARKQIAQCKYSLAERELETAMEWARSTTDQALVKLVKGVLLFKQGETATAGTALQSAEQELGGGVNGRFYLLLEATRQKCNTTTLLVRCGLSKTIDKIQQPDLMRLFQNLKGPLQNEDKALISAVFNSLKGPLKKCVHNDFTFSDGVQICETLNHFNIQSLRQSFAKAALKHWRRAPVYVYHELEAQFELTNQLSSKDISRLDKAVHKAHHDDEMGLVHRIDKLLEREMAAGSFDFPALGEDGPGNFHDLSAALDIDFLVDMMMDTFPPGEVTKLEKMVGKKELREMLKRFIIAQEGDFSFDEIGSLPNLFGAKKKKVSTKRRTAKKNPQQDDDRQLDLF